MLITIIGGFLVLCVLAALFSKSPQVAMQEANDKLEKARNNYENSVAELNEERSKIERELYEKRIEISNLSNADPNVSHGFNALNLSSLITDSLLKFGDIIEKIKNNYPPETRMIVCYMFFETLDKNFDEDTSLVAKFARAFIAQQLGDEAVEDNMLADDEDIVPPVFWANVLQGRIKSSYETLDNQNQKYEMCAYFTADISSSVEDENIRENFCSLLRSFMTEHGIFDENMEMAISGIEL